MPLRISKYLLRKEGYKVLLQLKYNERKSNNENQKNQSVLNHSSPFSRS